MSFSFKKKKLFICVSSFLSSFSHVKKTLLITLKVLYFPFKVKNKLVIKYCLI